MADSVVLPQEKHAKGRVLFISSDDLTQELIVSIMRSNGHSVVCERAEAVDTPDLIASHNLSRLFDMVVVDEPEANLNELPQLLAASGVDVPVVAMSVLLSVQRLLEAGYTDVIAKPVCPTTLLGVVNRLCSRSIA